MARVKTELKRTFGKVKEPIKVRKFLKLTEFTDELIEKRHLFLLVKLWQIWTMYFRF